jgi:hypothetical protein
VPRIGIGMDQVFQAGSEPGDERGFGRCAVAFSGYGLCVTYDPAIAGDIDC